MSAIVNSSEPSIETCLKCWYDKGLDADKAKHELATACDLGSRPLLQCMFDQLERCKGMMLKELTENSLTPITRIERELLWHAAFGEKLCKPDLEPVVKASFLRWLLTNPLAVKLISINGIQVEGIKIEGDLNLDNVTISFPIIIKNSEFKGDIKLRDAETRLISFEGSECKNIQAERVKVKGSLELSNINLEGKANFSGANITGNFRCSGGWFGKDPTNKTALKLDQSKIGGGYS